MRSSVHQPSLFASAGPRILIEDAEGGVVYRPRWLDPATAQRWFETLRDEVPWQSHQRPMYDRVVDVPRLTAGFRLASEKLPSVLRVAAELLNREVGAPFNAVGLNHYRDGNDSVAPHNDKLYSIVAPHPIALLSLGAARRMDIRAKQAPRTAIRIELEPGSLLVMSHASQHHWDHGVPKTKAPVGERISLALRVRPRDSRRRW